MQLGYDYTPISKQLISHEDALIQRAARYEVKKFFTETIDKFGDQWIRKYIEDQLSIYYGIITLEYIDVA
jgi:hypothetical protein